MTPEQRDFVNAHLFPQLEARRHGHALVIALDRRLQISFGRAALMRVHMQMPMRCRALVGEFILDELSGLPVQIAIPKWRRIEGVEQLR